MIFFETVAVQEKVFIIEEDKCRQKQKEMHDLII